MRFRMHKRTETKPDGRKIYYYEFEPVEAPNDTPSTAQDAQQARHEATEAQHTAPHPKSS